MGKLGNVVVCVVSICGIILFVVLTFYIVFLCVKDVKAEGIQTAAYTSRWSAHPEWHAEFAKYDLLVMNNGRPEDVAELRTMNADARVMHCVQPQWVYDATPNKWWIADTLWSIDRWWQLVCERENWYLRDTRGRKMQAGISGPGVLVNWTPYASRGRHGIERGLRPYEVYPRMVYEIAYGRRVWQPWSWDTVDGNLQGIVLEMLLDCMATAVGPSALRDADPNRDGRPDGSTCACSQGANRDFFSALNRAANTVFWREWQRLMPDLVVWLNDNRYSIHGPTWMAQADGRKLENWMSPAFSWSWWDWYRGRDGVGLRGPQRYSILRWPDNGNPRMVRLAVATSLLRDGCYVYIDNRTQPQLAPHWLPILETDMGRPVSEARVHARSGGFVMERRFERGTVTVNPNAWAVDGIQAMDARITR